MSQSTKQQIKPGFLKQHLPRIHFVWHFKHDFHPFRFIFIGTIIFLVIALVLFLSKSLSQNQFTFFNRASEVPENTIEILEEEENTFVVYIQGEEGETYAGYNLRFNARTINAINNNRINFDFSNNDDFPFEVAELTYEEEDGEREFFGVARLTENSEGIEGAFDEPTEVFRMVVSPELSSPPIISEAYLYEVTINEDMDPGFQVSMRQVELEIIRRSEETDEEEGNDSEDDRDEGDDEIDLLDGVTVEELDAVCDLGYAYWDEDEDYCICTNDSLLTQEEKWQGLLRYRVIDDVNNVECSALNSVAIEDGRGPSPIPGQNVDPDLQPQPPSSPGSNGSLSCPNSANNEISTCDGRCVSGLDVNYPNCTGFCEGEANVIACNNGSKSGYDASGFVGGRCQCIDTDIQPQTQSANQYICQELPIAYWDPISEPANPKCVCTDNAQRSIEASELAGRSISRDECRTAAPTTYVP